ncbi:Protochlorophyllide reductase C family protein [Hibiscus syriacus]|uniref:Protochlorophyllide reductase C family protein n=1 Tax=Hibiscus syriacus TaxID=106335 RepID=A0A6A2YF51_HIBSY|nr:Protochlorophyllide reductase C family protein [Hibiscus syriacus]
MNKLSHEQAKGLKLHVAQIGSGPKVVVFMHGFPEIWYSWRQQMVAVANASYRAISFDFRGYGLSDHPSEPERATFNDFVDDVIALFNSLGISKAHLVSKDFRAFVATMVGVLHPEIVCTITLLGVPFLLPGFSPLQTQLPLVPSGFYLLRWLTPGRAEVDFDRFDTKTIVRKIYIMFSGSEPPVAASNNQEIMDLVDSSTSLPPWLSEEDVAEYGSSYEKSRFRTALQVPYSQSLTVTMGDLQVVGEIKKLNNQNYNTGATCIESYLQGKAMFALKTTIEEEMLEHIRDAKSPKDAWDTFATLFSKGNDTKLKIMENELLSMAQRNMAITQYFHKLKLICCEISKLDPTVSIGEARIKRIIVHGLRPEYRSFVAAVQGWPTQPSLVEFENLLTDQETMAKKMGGVLLKSEEEMFYINQSRVGSR